MPKKLKLLILIQTHHITTVSLGLVRQTLPLVLQRPRHQKITLLLAQQTPISWMQLILPQFLLLLMLLQQHSKTTLPVSLPELLVVPQLTTLSLLLDMVLMQPLETTLSLEILGELLGVTQALS